ncbi:MAG: hypothetical protein H6Q84_271 [Deltaproteobacteria bacterium]|nr:hypothetical protein [Deltaproteobacteria bacterium]
MPLLFPAWFAASAYAFRALFRALRFDFLHTGEEAFFSCAAGLAWISLSALALGSFGQAGTLPFLAAAILTAGAGIAFRACAREPSVPPPVPSPRGYAVLLLAILPFPLVSIPPFYYDTLHYHYGLPSLFLRSGSVWPLPHFVESHFPLGVEMLNMVGLSDGSHVGANLVGFLSLFLCALGILALADRLGNRRAGLIAVPLFLFSSTALHAFFLQKNDPGVALFFFAFLYSLIPSPGGDGQTRKFRALAGAFCGMALGSKSTMPVFCAAVVPAFLALTMQRRTEGDPRGFTGEGLGPFLALAAAAWLPWLLRNAVSSGNPFYPLLNGIFGSPSWTPLQMSLLSGDAHSFSAMFHGPGDLAALAASLSFFPDTARNGPGASLGFAFVLSALSFVALPREAGPGWRFLRNVGASLVVAWFFTSWFSRFLLPALPGMALLSGFLLAHWTERLRGLRTAVTAAVVLACVGVQLASAAASPEQMGIFRAYRSSFLLFGRPDRAAQIASRFHAAYDAARFVNSSLPESARILFIGESCPYPFARDVVVASPFDFHPLQGIATADRPPDEVSRILAEEGYTHVLFNESEWRRLSASYYSKTWKPEDREAVERWVDTLRGIYRKNSVRVLALPAG